MFLFLLLSVFYLTGRAFIPHLGIQTDEALFVGGIYQKDAALYTVRGVPLMLETYIGTLKSFIYTPLFRILTPTTASTRVPMLLAGALTIWLLFLLLRRVSGTKAALTGCALLATDSMFLLTTVFDWGPVVLQHLLLAGAILLLYRWWERRGTGWGLALGFVLLGLALWDKALFVWSLGGLAAGALAVFPRQIFRLASPRRVGVAVASFLLGALPLVIYNLDNHWATFRGNVVYEMSDLKGKFHMLVWTAEGTGLFAWMFHEDGDPGTPLPPKSRIERASAWLSGRARHPRTNLMIPAFLAALALGPVLWRARARGARTMLFAVVFLAVAWLQMALNKNTGGSVHHVVLLWPFPQMVVAVAFAEAAERFRRWGRVALVVLLAAAPLSNLLVTNEYYRVMRRNGGGLNWTDAIYPLYDFTRQIRAQQIMPVDWGIFDSLRLLGAGRLPLRVGADPLSKPVLDARDQETVRQWLREPGTVFIGHTEGNEFFPGANARVAQVARECGLKRESLAVIGDRNGRQIFEVYRFGGGRCGG